MDYKYIDQLLERYWQGQTTLEEESILRTFFSQTDVPAELLRYKELFAYQQYQRQATVPGADFDERILAAIGQEPSAKAAPAVKARTISLSSRLAPLFRAAAVVAIILTLGNALQMPFSDNGYYQPSAYEETQSGEAVAMAGDSARMGVDRIDTLSQTLNVP
jgi:hypothetical protein